MKTTDELFKLVQNHTEDDSHAECIMSAIGNYVLSQSSKYSDLEKQVVELLGVTGCGNVMEVIEYVESLKSGQSF